MGTVRSAATRGAPVALLGVAVASPGVSGGAVADATYRFELAAVGAVVARVGSGVESGDLGGQCCRRCCGRSSGEFSGRRGGECGGHRGHCAAVIHPGGAAASVTDPASDFEIAVATVFGGGPLVIRIHGLVP
jgi:hypothetical protein